MKDRRPRKLKKKLKRKYNALFTLKTVRMAICSAFRVAMINSSFGTPKTEKALAILETVKDAAFSIQSIMSEKPTTWKEC